MNSLLLIEDEPSQRRALEEFLSSLGEFELYSAPDGATARTVLRDRKIDIVVSDLMLPDSTGIELVKEVRGQNRDIPFLILTGQPTIESAVEAIQEGATDYLTKPIELALLKKKLEGFRETINLKVENTQLKKRISETFSESKIIGNAPALREALDRARQVAQTDITVLIEGESGTGKELIANLLHENSNRAGKPFIRVNCGALTKSILESELFGSVKGAYTGAVSDRPGYFESANGGTIFLDEIGEMDLESQVRLLRVIEEQEVMRVGSAKPIRIDVRIIAATNRNLLKDADSGQFREDLYYRLSVIRLRLPALRERKEDIGLLFNHYILEFNDKYGKSIQAMSPELLKFFEYYDWPGNIRQFRNVIEGMCVLARDDILMLDDLPEEMRTAGSRTKFGNLLNSIKPGVKIEDYERAIIEKNLIHNGGNREKTAELLGISERTLYRKINAYGLQTD